MKTATTPAFRQMALQENSQNFPYGVLVVCAVRLLIGISHRHGLPRELLMRMPSPSDCLRGTKKGAVSLSLLRAVNVSREAGRCQAITIFSDSEE